MLIEKIVVLGAGGHSRVVVDALQSLGYMTRAIQVRDDKKKLKGSVVLGCAVEVPMLPLDGFANLVHAAVGSASLRQSLLESTGLSTDHWLTVIHPHATMAQSASLGAATFVAAKAVVGPCVTVGIGAILNHGAVVDHDCKIGDYTHIAPCASLGGGAQIGDRVQIGAGARVLPGVSIGSDVIVGAGSVVLSDIPPSQIWVGVPARQIEKE